MRFEWDRKKAAANFKKHKVSFDEAVTVFYDPLSATLTIPTILLVKKGFLRSAILLADGCS
jgi:hypothetical protein